MLVRLATDDNRTEDEIEIMQILHSKAIQLAKNNREKLYRILEKHHNGIGPHFLEG